MNTPEEKLIIATSRLINTQPFFAAILMQTMGGKAILDDTLDPPTAATNSQWIKFHPKFVEKCTLDELVFVLAHEVGHKIFEHIPRALLYKQMGRGPDMLPFNAKKWNYAGDYYINFILHDSSVGKMPMGGMYDPNISLDDTIDKIYMDLPDDDDDEPKGFDTHVDPDELPSEADTAQLKAEVKQAANLAKALGKLPTSLGKLVDQILNPTVPWQEVLRKEMSLAATNGELSWSKINRRRLVTSSVCMPARAGTTCGEIVCVVDTSGSIGVNEASKFLGEIKSICDDMNPEVLYILWTDTDVAQADELTDPHNDIDGVIEAILSKGTLPGGGGTDMPAAFKYCADYHIEPTTCVVFTDGYTPFGDEQPYPVIWAMTTDAEAPHGVNIKVEV